MSNRVIICGGRDFKDAKILEEAIKKSGFKIDEVVHGDARGADTLAGQWAKKNNIPVKPFPAKWKDLSHPDAKIKKNRWGQEYDAMAGFRRNEEMAKYATHCISVEGGNGTADMIKRAKEHGLKVFEYETPKEYKYEF